MNPINRKKVESAALFIMRTYPDESADTQARRLVDLLPKGVREDRADFEAGVTSALKVYQREQVRQATSAARSYLRREMLPR